LAAVVAALAAVVAAAVVAAGLLDVLVASPQAARNRLIINILASRVIHDRDLVEKGITKSS
jgi:hypothetical protein